MDKEVKVIQIIKVTIDESKFTDKFMAEFRKTMYSTFHDLNDHYMHLAQLYARNICDDNSFIEGYGLAKDMGIEFNIIDMNEEMGVDE